MPFYLIIFLFLVSPGFGFAQEPVIDLATPKELYLEGVKHFQKADFKKASEAFRLAYAKQPQNRSILFNWGLSEFKQNRIGMAAGAWRRALAIDPEFSAAERALQMIAPKITSMNQQELNFFESFRASVLQKVSGIQIGLTGLLFFLAAGWTFLGYLGRRKRALVEHTSLPSFPVLPICFSILFGVSLFTGAGKIYDYFQPRATIISTNASVFSSPSDNSPTLFEVSEGFEVILRQKREGWTQVASPGGLSGWIKHGSFFQTSGYRL